MTRNFLTVWDLSQEDITSLLDRAIDLKVDKSISAYPLKGKSIGLLFEKASTRTRLSFEVGIYQLGGNPIYLKPEEIQLKRGETIGDTIRVLSRYLNGVIIRTFEHEKIEDFAAYSTVPVVNGLTDKHHPCQALADLMTIREKKDRLKGIRLAYLGDGNNVANSLIEASSRMGLDMIIACPEGYEPDFDVIEKTREAGKSELTILRDPKEAVAWADVIYTDVWVSMGDKVDAEEKKAKLKKYQLNDQLMCYARKDVTILHCLPAHRGEEITDAVIDGPHSAVFDQAENRLHSQKALLEMLIE